jgi:hypothetical protein
VIAAAVSNRRLGLGRVQLYIEPRDIWMGVYVGPKAVFICPVPLVVIRIARRAQP